MPQAVEPALQTLRELADDPRWRMREGVCFGLQRLIPVYPDVALTALAGWIPDGSWLELRAAAAGVAEPPLLKNHDVALAALHLHERILDRVLQAHDRKSESFRTLRKGLGYTLSVIVQAIPEEGFPWLAKIIDTSDPDVLWIVRQNLKKKRLLKPFPTQVDALVTQINDQAEQKS
jgi:hypothetical protein